MYSCTIALDGIENEELRNLKTCYQHVKAAIKDNESYYLFLAEQQNPGEMKRVRYEIFRAYTGAQIFAREFFYREVSVTGAGEV